MNKIETGFAGLYQLLPRVFEDARGYFFESFNQKEMDFAGLSHDWVQDNQSFSRYGAIRGLHFQKDPFAQAKLIRVLEGKILDVVVDIREGSPTFKKVYGVELSAENRIQLLVPKGFAHGFSVLSATATVLYKCDNYYHAGHEGGIRHDDPELAIDWGVPASSRIISDKDAALPALKDIPKLFIHHG
jgi:dTDP-4-dehydrorhamnose 3,5-epimerase